LGEVVDRSEVVEMAVVFNVAMAIGIIGMAIGTIGMSTLLSIIVQTL
jgi:hypothetical protein